jgi:ribosome-associated translation inhibitor RaiA
MNLRITAPNLNPPTYSTLKEYSLKRFKKLDKMVRLKKGSKNLDLKISVSKVGDLFKLTAEISNPYHVVIHTVDRDLRKLIDDALHTMSRKVRKTKEKLIDSSRTTPDLSFGYPQLLT